MIKKLVVSNYNSDLEWLKMTYDHGFSVKNTVIYDRSDELKDWSHLGRSITSPNVGENIYDMMRFIIENYNNLPDITIFIKGNLFSRELGGPNYYTTPERFIRSLHAEYFLPIERYHESTSYFVNCGNYIEKTWVPNGSIPRKYFSSFNELLNLLFDNPPNPEYNRFAPGGNYVVPKGNIIKYSCNFYEKLKLYCSHSPMHTCAEAFLIERLLYMMWTEDLVEKKDESV